MLICTLGDLLLDVIVRVDGPIAVDTDTFGQTRVGAGGQAANVAAWAAELGATARFIGKRGRGAAARLTAAELRGHGVEVVGPEVDGDSGAVVSVAGADGTRTMLTDRGVAPALSPGELEPAWLDGCDWLHVPGYSLTRSPIAEAAVAAARRVDHVSVDISSVAAVQEVGVERFRDLLRELHPEIVFATEAEAALVGATGADTVVVKRGPRGCLVRRAGEGEEAFDAIPADAIDTTGAGDAFAAGFLVGGPQLALATAARCVGKLGAMP